MSPLAASALVEAEALLAARRVDLAVSRFHQAEHLGADPNYCAGQRWTCYMLLGDYERAWQQSDALRARQAPDPHRLWNGTPLHGQRVLVRSVHGFGDAVQTLRYAPLIRDIAERLTVQVAPALAELARMVTAIDEVIVWEEERPFDVQVEITELPYIFRSTLHTLPKDIPYLHFPDNLLAEAARRLETPSSDKLRPLRIGLVWTSSAWDPSRSIPLALLAPLVDALPGAAWWCLQPTSLSSEWEAFCSARALPARRAGDYSASMFAACLAQMDLLITIDSFAAHVCGALGRPAWLLLKHQADWRWMLTREDSPWYPTLRLFRQSEEGAWARLIATVVQELACLLKRRE